MPPIASPAPSAPPKSPEEEQDPKVPATPAADPDDATDDDPADPAEDPAPPADPPAPPETEPAPANAQILGAFDRGRLMLSSKKSLIATIDRQLGEIAALRARITALEPAAALASTEADRVKTLQAELAAEKAKEKSVSAGVRDELTALGVTKGDAPPVLTDLTGSGPMTKEEALRQYAEAEKIGPAAAREFYLAHKDILL
jgi:hypothetical protein